MLMQFTEESLKKIERSKEYNKKYAAWLWGMSQEFPHRASTFINQQERLLDCMNLFLWDVYHKNKVMDLKRVNRCMNNRFCPNCRKLDLAKTLHNFSEPFKKYLLEGYYPYMITLTVPNVKGSDLEPTLKHMSKAFRKLYTILSKDIKPVNKWVITDTTFRRRLMQFDGALRVLEITVRHNEDGSTKDFHPHYHVILFSKEYNPVLFDKYIPGPYSTKRQRYDMFSDLDINIMKLWKMCYDNIRFTNKNYDNLSSEWYNLYMCNICELTPEGIYEVLKYTFKDTDIQTYYDFKTIKLALENKRLRQGYGILYNIKFECDDSKGDLQDINEYCTIAENPEDLLTKEISVLYTIYKDYIKISRFRAYNEYWNIE